MRCRPRGSSAGTSHQVMSPTTSAENTTRPTDRVRIESPRARTSRKEVCSAAAKSTRGQHADEHHLGAQLHGRHPGDERDPDADQHEQQRRRPAHAARDPGHADHEQQGRDGPGDGRGEAHRFGRRSAGITPAAYRARATAVLRASNACSKMRGCPSPPCSSRPTSAPARSSSCRRRSAPCRPPGSAPARCRPGRELAPLLPGGALKRRRRLRGARLARPRDAAAGRPQRGGRLVRGDRGARVRDRGGGRVRGRRSTGSCSCPSRASSGSPSPRRSPTCCRSCCCGRPSRAAAGEAARLASRLRQRGSTLLVLGPWARAEATLEVDGRLLDGHRHRIAATSPAGSVRVAVTARDIRHGHPVRIRDDAWSIGEADLRAEQPARRRLEAV